MRTPNERQEALVEALQPNVPYMEAYGAVRAAIEEVMPFDRVLTTEQMVELIAPKANWIHGDRETLARHRVYKALNGLALHGLKPWVTLDRPVVKFGGMMRRKLWKRVATCPFCAGTGLAQ